jgi:magnesium-transporting ATPase (P-type)
MLKRFNPFEEDLASLADPPFDPRKQSWVAGALSAIEAFVGAMFALPMAVSIAWAISWFSMGTYQREHQREFVTVNAVAVVGAFTLLSAAFLWAGLALMFGWRSRYRAHGALAFVIIVLSISLMLLQFVQVGLEGSPRNGIAVPLPSANLSMTMIGAKSN